MKQWFVYVLVSRKNRTYVGVSIDVDRRLEEHNGERKGGAKATRMGRPWLIGKIYGPFSNRSEAQRVEYEVKRLKGPARLDYKRESTA